MFSSHRWAVCFSRCQSPLPDVKAAVHRTDSPSLISSVTHSLSHLPMDFMFSFYPTCLPGTGLGIWGAYMEKAWVSRHAREAVALLCELSPPGAPGRAPGEVPHPPTYTQSSSHTPVPWQLPWPGSALQRSLSLGRGVTSLPPSHMLLWTLDGSSPPEHRWEKQGLLGDSPAALRLLSSG